MHIRCKLKIQAIKICTKKGDTGQTVRFGGTRVPKHHIRVEAYGTVDELNSLVGLLAAQRSKADTIAALQKTQRELLNLGALLATPQDKQKRPDIASVPMLPYAWSKAWTT